MCSTTTRRVVRRAGAPSRSRAVVRRQAAKGAKTRHRNWGVGQSRLGDATLKGSVVPKIKKAKKSWRGLVSSAPWRPRSLSRRETLSARGKRLSARQKLRLELEDHGG